MTRALRNGKRAQAGKNVVDLVSQSNRLKRFRSASRLKQFATIYSARSTMLAGNDDDNGEARTQSGRGQDNESLALVAATCLTFAGASSAGILRMNCQKRICGCTVYGPFFGCFPYQWRVAKPQAGASMTPVNPPTGQPPAVMPRATMITPDQHSPAKVIAVLPPPTALRTPPVALSPEQSSTVIPQATTNTPDQDYPAKVIEAFPCQVEFGGSGN